LGYPQQALKAYYAAVVHFPKEISWNAGKPWYVGVAALDAVYRLLYAHPEWKMDLQGAFVKVENGFDRKVTNDNISVHPGTWVNQVSSMSKDKKVDSIKNVESKGSVQLVQYSNDHWQLMVNRKPYLIRGVAFSPTPIGRSPDTDGYQPHADWMLSDANENGHNDMAYDSWVDVNQNNIKERNEPMVGDFQLLKKMGANAIRLYHHGEEKKLLRELSQRYGIRVLMGDLLGAYTVGSTNWK
jgi:beta-glucuronidase